MSNKIELKLSSSVSEYEVIWNEEYIGNIVASTEDGSKFIHYITDIDDYMSKPEFLRDLAETLESLNKD